MATIKYQPTNAFAMKGNIVTDVVLAISHTSWAWGTTDVSTAVRAYVIANTQDIVVSWDGTDPTATLGLPLAAGSSLEVYGNVNIQNLKMIRAGISDATVTVILEK